jgi:hypothetical protein
VIKRVAKAKQLGRALALGDVDFGPAFDHVKGEPVHDVKPIEVAEDGNSKTIKVNYPADKGGVAGRGEESAHATFELGQSVFVDINGKVSRTERDLDTTPSGGSNSIADVGVVLDSWEDVSLLEVEKETRGTSDLDKGPGVGEEAAGVISETPSIHIINPGNFEQENVSADVEEQGGEGAALLYTPLDQDAEGKSSPKR